VEDAALKERITVARVRQIQTQVRRLALPYALHETLVAWLLWHVGLGELAVAWLIIIGTMHVVRARYVRGEIRAPDAETELRHLSAMFVALGIGRGFLTLALFSTPVADSHYVFTMLVVGLAAGGVGSVGGVVRTYVAWALAVGGPLVTVWLLQGTPAGYGLGLVTAGLFATLASAVRDQGVALERLVATAYEKELLAESLRLERDRANVASQSKTRFFAAASHDLRQPLHALSINATTLELVAKGQSSPIITELSQGILRALRQSNNLLDGLLDVSRLDANAVEVRPEAIEIFALLETIREEFAPVASQRQLALRVADAGSIALWVESDRDLLVRILSNLVSNALKFTPAGEVLLFAHREALAAGRPVVVFGVRDTGIGIARAEHSRVFEEFYQIANASRDRSLGLGLGLSIVKRTADLLGIGLTMDSEQGRGTEFRLSTSAIAPPAAPTAPRDVDGEIPRLDARVLVIDDEPDILESLGALLPYFGCQVRVAEGIEQAQAIIDSGFEPDAFLVDHRLPGLSGLELLSRLHAADSPEPLVRPAIIITGDTAPDSIQKAQSGGFKVLHKPLDGRKLARSLIEVLASKAAPASDEATNAVPVPVKA
jgi:signal transduction histidine kinase/CheY-like chemotaxis protein